MAKLLLVVLAACVMLATGVSAVVGGKESAETQSPEVLDAANFVLASANHNDCSGLCAGLKKDGELKLVKVVSASTQVVAGVNYHLELLMADDSGKQSLVTSTVWSRPWLAAKNDAAHPATQITKLTYKAVEGTEA